MNNIFLGFDPGSTGSVAIIQDGRVIKAIPFPQIKVQSKKASKTREGEYKKDKAGKRIYPMVERLDEEYLVDIVKKLKSDFPDAKVVLEKVKNIMGSGAMQNFNFGYSFGFLSGLITYAGFNEVHLVTPQNWQKNVIYPIDRIKNADGSNDTKGTSLNAVKRLFPNLDLRATPRSTKFHNGMVDAVLIAWYGWIEIGHGKKPEPPEQNELDLF